MFLLSVTKLSFPIPFYFFPYFVSAGALNRPLPANTLTPYLGKFLIKFTLSFKTRVSLLIMVKFRVQVSLYSASTKCNSR